MNDSGRDLHMLKLCVAGAAGKMGNAIIREAAAKGFQVVGAVEAPGNVCISKSLRTLGIKGGNDEHGLLFVHNGSPNP